LPSGQYCVDAYDAIWGTLFASSKQWKLVHTFHSLKEVLEMEWLQVDILVLGNWAYPTAFQDETIWKALAWEVYHKLRELEVDRLPPLDYVWYFAQKVHYYHKLFAKRDFCDSNGACAHGALLEKKTAGFCQGTMCGRVNVEA
jgi:hypothetical protein